MRRLFYFWLISAVLLVTGVNSWAEESKGEAPKEKFPVCGIKMGGEVHPGDDLQIVFSVVGPPDEILPMRTKNKDADSDYIHFIYRNRFMININKKNAVQSITTIGNNVETVNVPFKIGQAKKDVISQWGEPEHDTSGMLIYYYRGVYIIYTKEEPDKIDRIYMTLPGKVESEDKKKTAAG